MILSDPRDRPGDGTPNRGNVEWNNQNYVGRLTDDALDAEAAAARYLSAAGCAGCRPRWRL